MSHIANVEPGLRIPIPPEWADALGDKATVSLERTREGILIRPHAAPEGRLTWDDFLADKLTVGSGQQVDTVEVRDSDYLL